MTTRKEILEMLSAGEIDVERATEMLAAPAGELDDPALPALPVPAEAPAETMTESRKGKFRWLRVHVSDLKTGRARVRVNVPMALVNVGLKLGARFTNELDDEMIRSLLESIHDEAVTGTLVEVEDVEDNEYVRVFID